MKMKTIKEVTELKYTDLQKYAAEIEEFSGVEIDRSATKLKLTKAVLDAMKKGPKTEDKAESEETEETTEETSEETETSTESEVTEEATEETEKPTSKKKVLYVATKKYKDWASGWEFDPSNPEMNEPIEIKKMTSGLKNAIAKGVIVKAK